LIRKRIERKELIVMKPNIAVYPGSFDPVTNGHLDILMRGLEVFDKIIVVVAYNTDKAGLFTIQERIDLLRASLGDAYQNKVVLDSFEGLLVDYVKKVGAKAVLRGLRAMSDFEYEFQMASMNRNLNNDMDTLFMMTSKDYFFVSSRSIKEVASFGGSIKGCVPDVVEEALKKKFQCR
jgi:pantetheine-phosphate adenylyltransferase